MKPTVKFSIIILAIELIFLVAGYFLIERYSDILKTSNVEKTIQVPNLTPQPKIDHLKSSIKVYEDKTDSLKNRINQLNKLITNENVYQNVYADASVPQLDSFWTNVQFSQ